MRRMAFPRSTGVASECSNNNGLNGLIKHLGRDRTLQHERFQHELETSPALTGFRSRSSTAASSPALSASDNLMANDFFHSEEVNRSSMSSPFQQPSPAVPMLKEDWVHNFHQEHSRHSSPGLLSPAEESEMEQAYAKYRHESPAPLAPFPHAQYSRQQYLFQRGVSSSSSKATSTSSSQVWIDDFAQHQQFHPQMDEEALQRAFEKVQLENEERQIHEHSFAARPAINISSTQRQKLPARTDSSSSHLLDSKDWSKEFSKYHDLSAVEQQPEAHLATNTTTTIAIDNQEDDDVEEWLRKYQRSFENRQNFMEQAIQEKGKQPWDRLKAGYGYRAIHPEYEKYHFTSNNPYLTHQNAIDQQQHSTLADAIMALEAKVQIDPQNAQAWEQLGLKQQENERDAAAITALEKAVALDSGLLDAWMGLAVSYTNEHCRMDAYNCLEQWLYNNPDYKHILYGRQLGRHDSKDEKKRHDYITELFLEAARYKHPSSSVEMEKEDTGLYAEVQVGLGILFNMSEEYLKAIDCFKAALVTRPNDYQLWNKLGATLANSRDMNAAIEMYFNALEINPAFVRARYNLAISCMNLGQYREAAEHLLTTLDLQRAAAMSAAEAVRRMDTDNQTDNVSTDIPNCGTSDGIWDSLRLLMFMMSREDLAAECDKQNLEAFRRDFEF